MTNAPKIFNSDNTGTQRYDAFTNTASNGAAVYSGGMGFIAAVTGGGATFASSLPSQMSLSVSTSSITATATGGTIFGASIFLAAGVAGGLGLYGITDMAFKNTLGEGESIGQYFEDQDLNTLGFDYTRHIREWNDNSSENYSDLYQMYSDPSTDPLHKNRNRLEKWQHLRKKASNRQRDYEEALANCPDGGTQKRFKWVWDKAQGMYILLPEDPNLIIGPDGQPTKKWVSVKDRMPYTILFENDTTATARTRYIKITSPIEPKQDAITLQLGSFGFNNQSFDIPAGTSSYYQRLDTRDSTGVFVDITAGYDVIGNKIFWEFQAIDPTTLLPPEDPLAGFLFLQDSTQPDYGNGFVNFSIKPKSNSQTLDTIGARAFIVFDENDVIPTNIHTNTIDALPPTSQLNTINGTGTNPITLSWTGADDTNGSGIGFYTIYVSLDQISYSVLFPKVYGNDTTFSLPPDSAYCFFVLATDRVGNAETLRQGVVKCTSIGVTLPVTLLYFNGTNQGTDNLLKWATSSEQNSKEFVIERSLTGSSFTSIGRMTAAGNSSSTTMYQYTDQHIDRLNSDVMFYRLKQYDLDNRFMYSNIVRLNYRKKGATPTIVYPNPTNGVITILIGDNKLIGTEAIVSDANGRILQRIKITATTETVDMKAFVNGIYFIRLSNNETLKIIKQ